MKLYVVVGRINGQLGFAVEHDFGAKPILGCSNTRWNISAFSTVEKAHAFHDSLTHGFGKLCKVVEIEIPDEE